MDIVKFLKTIIAEDPNLRKVDLRDGSAIVDLLIKPHGILLKPLSDDLNSIKLGQSIANYASMSEDDMDLLAGNSLILRDPGNRATSSVRLYFTSARDVEIRIGREFKTSTGLVFKASAYYNISESVLSSRRDVTTGLYFTDSIPVIAAEVGADYVIDAGEITDMVNPIPALAKVENLSPAIGGSSRMSNAELYELIKSSASTRQLLNQPGTFSRLKTHLPTLLDILTIGHGDTEMLRDETFDLSTTVGDSPLADFRSKLRYDPTNPSVGYALRTTEVDPDLASFTDEFTQAEYVSLGVSGDAETVQTDASTLFDEDFVRTGGFVPASTPLSSDNDGSDTLEVESGGRFAVGDLVEVSDDDSGSLTRAVIGVTSSTIRVSETVPAQYTYAQNALVTKLLRDEQVGNGWIESEHGQPLGIEIDGAEVTIDTGELVFGKASYATDTTLNGVSKAQLQTDVKALFKAALVSAGYNAASDADIIAEIDALEFDDLGTQILEDLDADFVTDAVTTAHFVGIDGVEHGITHIFDTKLRLATTPTAGNDLSYEVVSQVALSVDQDDGSTDATGLIFTDADATFVTDNVAVGDHVVLPSDRIQHQILTVDSETQLTLVNGFAMTGSQSGLTYRITRAISLTGDQTDGRINYGLIDLIKEQSTVDVFPVIQRALPQNNGLKISGTLRTNDDSALGQYSYISIRKNPTGNASYYQGFGVAWKKSVEDTGTTTTTSADTVLDDSIVSVVDTTGFPSAGTAYVDGVLISYTAKTSTTLTGCVGVEASTAGVNVRPGHYNLYIVDNGDLPNNANAYLSRASVPIVAGTDYSFELIFAPPTPSDVTANSTALSARLWDELESRPTTPSISYGAYIPVQAQNSLADNHFGLSVAGCSGSQWYYDDILVESIADQYAQHLYKLSTSGFNTRFKVRVRTWGTGDNAGIATDGATVQVWKDSTSSWQLVGSNALSVLANVESTGLDTAAFADSNGYVWVRTRTTYPQGSVNPATLYVDYAAILDDGTAGFHVGGKVDVLIRSSDRMIRDTVDLLTVSRMELTNAENGFDLPIGGIESVVVLDVGGEPTGAELVEGTDWSLFVGSPGTRYSMRETNALMFDSGSIGLDVRVTYLRMPHIDDAQILLDTQEERAPDADWLARGFRPVFVDLDVEAEGYADSSTEMANILVNHINQLGDTIDVSMDVSAFLIAAGAVDVTTPITINLEEHLIDGRKVLSSIQDEATLSRDARFVARNVTVTRKA